MRRLQEHVGLRRLPSARARPSAHFAGLRVNQPLTCLLLASHLNTGARTKYADRQSGSQGQEAAGELIGLVVTIRD